MLNSSTINYKNSQKACRLVRLTLLIAIVLSLFFQFAIEPSASNIACSLIAACISIATVICTLRPSAVMQAPLPSLMAFGANLTTILGALLAQTSSWRPLTYNLKAPEITFIYTAFFQVSVILSLVLFLKLKAPKIISSQISNKLVARINLLKRPTHFQIWFIGFIGLAAQFWTSGALYSGELGYGDASGKFLFTLTYLMFFPYLLPIISACYPELKNQRFSKGTLIFIGLYTVLILIGAAARNSRGSFAIGMANLGLFTFLLIICGQLTINARMKKWLFGTGVVIALMYPTLSDIVTAMAVVRGERGKLTNIELVYRTLDAFSDKTSLNNYRKSKNVTLDDGAAYDETYISNPFVARFVRLKFFDNTLSLENVRAGKYSDHIRGITIDKLAALLPTPFLRALGSSLDKSKLEFSMGDALYDREYGGGLGGRRTGSPVAHGLSMFGWATFIFSIPMFILTFTIMQSLTAIRNGQIIFSPIVLLRILIILGLLTGDSLVMPLEFILRKVPQDAFSYLVLFLASGFIYRFISGKKRLKISHAQTLAL